MSLLTRMEQTGKNKTKHTSQHTSTWSNNKQAADARIPSDAYWKYAHRNNQDNTDKNIRRHKSPMPEQAVNYYTPANSYKNIKHHIYPCSTHPKNSPAFHTEMAQRYQQTTTRPGKNKDYAKNISGANKDRYMSQQENRINVEYIDEEPGNFTEDNVEDDAEEEVNENNQEKAGESLDKEYDEQEADDEIDEESDAPAEPHALQQNAAKKDALLRAQQRLRIMNQQQNSPHRIHYSQHSPKLYQADPLATRYYRNIPDHDIHEALSEEDLYTAQVLKNPPRRLSAGYHQNWIPRRNSIDRYDTTTSPIQPNRRIQTRPEMKSFIEAEFVDRRKCNRCGNISIRKPPLPRRNNYKFQDNSNLSAKTHFVDDAETFNPSWCGHCKPKHHFEENIGPCKTPSPTLYAMNLRRSRDTNIPMHETLGGKRVMDELSHEYARMPSRYIKDTPNILRDRIRHSVQTARSSPIRMVNHYDS